MLRRFAGLQGDSKVPQLEVPFQMDVGIIVYTPRGLQFDQLDMETPQIKRLANLITQAGQFRKPPDYLVEMIGEALIDIEEEVDNRIRNLEYR